jgi:DNA polymerase elongation subunit (family B)
MKFFGAYSYRTQSYYFYNLTDTEKIKALLKNHRVIIGHNIKDFDIPIMSNKLNNYKDSFEYKVQIDTLLIARKRLNMMLNVKKEQVKTSRFGLDYCHKALFPDEESKGQDFDYEVLKKDLNDITPEELEKIKAYTLQDIKINKDLFEEMAKQFYHFKFFMDEKNQKNYKWLSKNFGSYAYSVICNLAGMNEEYEGWDSGYDVEYEGAYVIEPRYIELHDDIYLLDFSSMYPHNMLQFNLFTPCTQCKEYHKECPFLFTGNNMFKVKGEYCIENQGKIEKIILGLYLKRKELKEKEDLQEQALKIVINCFDKNTEIVTCNGIKRIQECVVGDMVYSINPITLELEEKPIINICSQYYIGEMHRYKNDYFDFNVTPEHKLLLKTSYNKFHNIPTFVKSKDIKSSNKIPKHLAIKRKILTDKIAITDLYDGQKLKIIVIPTQKHGRTWLYENNILKKYDHNLQQREQRLNKKLGIVKIGRRLSVKNIQYKKIPRMHAFIFKYDDIKDSIHILKDCDVYCKHMDRPKEHKIPFFYDINEFIKFCAWYITEGSLDKLDRKKYEKTTRGDVYRICIQQSRTVNELYCLEIIDMFKKLKLKMCNCGDCFTTSNKILFDIMETHFGKGSYNKKISNRIFELLGSEQYKILFDTMIKGDGTKKIPRYTTASNQLKNDFIKLLLYLGGTFLVRNDGYWRIHYNFNDNWLYNSDRCKQIYQYNDIVYNLTVADNHTVLAGSNGKFNWIGQSIYGITAKSTFKHMYYPNRASDCTLIGRQLLQYADYFFRKKGYQVIYGDTDSTYLKDPFKNRRKLIRAVQELIGIFKRYIPFPSDTFTMAMETPIKDIWCFRKKHYMYITDNDKLKIKGLPIIKSNASNLSVKILRNYLEPLIIERRTVHFPKSQIRKWIADELKLDPNIIATEFTIKNKESDYKSTSCIEYQILKKYGSGKQLLIKNRRRGVGMSVKYCSIEEAKILDTFDLDLSTVFEELSHFYFDDEKRVLTDWE